VALAAGRPSAARFRDVTDVTRDALSPGLRETYAGISHMLAVPVRAGGEDIALLCVSRRRTEEFTAADSAMLDAVAAAAAQPLRAARIKEQLDAALAQLSELSAQADSVELIKTDILRLASHELRSPLTVLHGYLSLVQGGFFGEIPEPLAGVLGILHRRTEEMNALVNDMLVAARVEDIPPDTAREIADLRDLIRDATAGVMPRASAGHSLRVDLPENAVLARVDVDRVVLALRNIIDNAIKYSPNGGEVRCQLVREGEIARIRVADHGLGIAEEDRDKLFTRFGRVLTTANSHIPGIGLGLYFSREVARRHGGDVALIEGETRAPGSVFEVTLPIAG
jgi:signal transduction histidine kinase